MQTNTRDDSLRFIRWFYSKSYLTVFSSLFLRNMTARTDFSYFAKRIHFFFYWKGKQLLLVLFYVNLKSNSNIQLKKWLKIKRLISHENFLV